jgi:hypothetical protein
LTSSGCQTKPPQAQARCVLIAYPDHWTDGSRANRLLRTASRNTSTGFRVQPGFLYLSSYRNIARTTIRRATWFNPVEKPYHHQRFLNTFPNE